MVRILWAEDSLQDRQLIREALVDIQDAPRVTFVADGMQILERAPQDQPDLIVLDLQMAGLGGVETLKRLRADPATRGQQVVVFTSSDRPQEMQECRLLGARDCVQKPLDFAAFVFAVQRVLGPVGAARMEAAA